MQSKQVDEKQIQEDIRFNREIRTELDEEHVQTADAANRFRQQMQIQTTDSQADAARPARQYSMQNEAKPYETKRMQM
ncbi:hypothetical protein Tco_1489179 [Tanacetum coccineum]